jgi:hypothetical protein
VSHVVGVPGHHELGGLMLTVFDRLEWTGHAVAVKGMKRYSNPWSVGGP